MRVDETESFPELVCLEIGSTTQLEKSSVCCRSMLGNCFHQRRSVLDSSRIFDDGTLKNGD
jgi:hypothetical protein